jgi:hypothetical protein
MANVNAKHDDNSVSSAIFVQEAAQTTVAPGQIDQITGRILVDLGSVPISGSLQTDVFVATANQTAFTASLTVAATVYLSVNGQIITPSNVDPNGYYTLSGGVATLSSGAVVGSIVIWCYATA